MKKSLLFFAIYFFTINGKAQVNPIIGTYTKDVDSMFQHLDKSGITSGILYDRVFPFANLPFFINPGQPDTIDFSFFIQGSSELRRAAYNSSNNNLPPEADYFYALYCKCCQPFKGWQHSFILLTSTNPLAIMEIKV